MKALLVITLLIPFMLNGYTQQHILIIADEWPQMDLMAKKIMENDHSLIQKSEQDQIASDLSGFDFVFMYVHKPLYHHAEQILINYATEGGSLIVLHHGIASAKMQNPAWLGFLGIQLFPRDHQQYPWGVLSDTTHTMVNLFPGHFITGNGIHYEKRIPFYSEYDTIYRGVYEAFDLRHTEIFLNQHFTGERHNILFGFSTADGSRMQPTSGWYKKTGKGWVFYYQAGHSITDFENQNFMRILLNTLQWYPESDTAP